MDLEKKRVLVTGADGFIGSHLTEMLVQRCARVSVTSCYNSFNHWGWLDELDCLNEIEVLAGDIRDPLFCRRMTRNIDIVFHLAALISIPYSYSAPESYIDNNIKGTLNICQAALDNGCGRLIHTSTSEVYGTALYVPIDEKHPLQPQSPYSASKIGADCVAMSFFHSFDLPVVIARPFNTYGPRQSARAVIPSVVTQIAGGSRTIHLGDLTPTRDFNYVKDTCQGMILLSQCDNAEGETFNIGSNHEVTIGWVVDLIRELMRSDAEIVTEAKRIRPEKSEVYRLWCDNRKICSLTGFVPSYDIREGLERTIDWFSQHSNLKKYKTAVYHV